MEIRKLKKSEKAPMDLLLLADPSLERVDGYLQKGECFVAEVNQRIIGVFVLLPVSADVLELANIAVLPGFQNHGFGKEMLRAALQLAREKGCQTMIVATGNSSLGQLAFYQKCGFRIVGVDSDYFVDHYPEKIFENGIQCRDRIRLSRKL